MAPKKAAKSMGRPRSTAAKPESVARRERWKRAQEGKARKVGRPGRPKGAEPLVKVSMLLPESLLARIDRFSADDVIAGRPRTAAIRFLLACGLEARAHGLVQTASTAAAVDARLQRHARARPAHW